MSQITMSAHDITIDGIAYACTWSCTPSGTVYAFVDAEDGATMRVKYAPGTEYHAAAQAAWQAEQDIFAALEAETYTKQDLRATSIAPADAEPIKQPTVAPVRAFAPKTMPYVGMTIKGKTSGIGWVIDFNAAYNRTVMTFKRCPSDAVRQLVKDAGFNWAPSMGAWVRKLNKQSFDTAQALAEVLSYYPHRVPGVAA